MPYPSLPHRHGEGPHTACLWEHLAQTGRFQTIADVFGRLSDATRVRIFWLLCHCEECVVNISAMLGMSSPAVSHHLRALKDSGLLVSRRDGKEVYYRAADTAQSRLLHRMMERVMEIACPEAPRDVPDPVSSPACTGHTAGRAGTCAGHTDTCAGPAGICAGPAGICAGLAGTCPEHTGNCAGQARAPLLPPDRMAVVHAVHDQLLGHMEQRITIEALSRQHHINPTTLKAAFKAVYGASIAAHIKQHRMEQAAGLLRQTDMSIADIARAVGYDSQSRLTAAFKSYFHTVPTEYRRQSRGQSGRQTG